MFMVDVVILSLGCMACGLLSASSLILSMLRGLRVLVYALMPLKTSIGAVTALAGLVSLLFPADGPPIFGSLLPGAVGLLLGVLLCLEMLMDTRFFRRYKEIFVRFGNALLYLKNPLGLLSIFAGIMHLLFSKTLFF
jgi:hypothetical protein